MSSNKEENPQNKVTHYIEECIQQPKTNTKKDNPDDNCKLSNNSPENNSNKDNESDSSDNETYSEEKPRH